MAGSACHLGTRCRRQRPPRAQDADGDGWRFTKWCSQESNWVGLVPRIVIQAIEFERPLHTAGLWCGACRRLADGVGPKPRQIRVAAGERARAPTFLGEPRQFPPAELGTARPEPSSGDTMSQPEVEAALGRLICDDEFRREFFRDPRLAAHRSGLQLSDLEISGLRKITATTFERLARVLDDRIRRADEIIAD
jgi:hypothetical protein